MVPSWPLIWKIWRRELWKKFECNIVLVLRRKKYVCMATIAAADKAAACAPQVFYWFEKNRRVGKKNYYMHCGSPLFNVTQIIGPQEEIFPSIFFFFHNFIPGEWGKKNFYTATDFQQFDILNIFFFHMKNFFEKKFQLVFTLLRKRREIQRDRDVPCTG